MEREEQSENSLHTIAIILLCCGAVKMLHLLGVITVEGESVLQLLTRTAKMMEGLCLFMLSMCKKKEKRSVLFMLQNNTNYEHAVC